MNNLKGYQPNKGKLGKPPVGSGVPELNRRITIRYEIQPKSANEYCDVVDTISDFLDQNNIKHKKEEIDDPDPNQRSSK